MSEPGFKARLERLGLRQSELARLVDVSARTVSQWARGGVSVPGTVLAYLRVLEVLPPELLAKEFNRLEGRRRMFDEGIYSLTYRAGDCDQSYDETALAVLRKGKILGSDRRGGLFTGSYEYDAVTQLNRMHVRLQVPPDGTLFNGADAGPGGAVVDISGAFDRATPTAHATVDIAGARVELRLTYLGPLPN